MLVQFPLLRLSLITIKVTRLVYYLYQCFMTCHRVDGIPYEKDILSKYIKLKLMKQHIEQTRYIDCAEDAKNIY